MRDDKTIFERSRPGRAGHSQFVAGRRRQAIPDAMLRRGPVGLPEVSELQAVRHYTRLSQRNFAIDTHFYPLGSCTMKYNPRGANRLAMLPGFLNHHPATPADGSQGVLACLYDLQEILREVTGMRAVSLSPMAGAQGEFAGVAMIRAYHESRGDRDRDEILVPDAAHGTNPASAVMCGYKVREIPTNDQGDVDLAALDAALGPRTAGIMLTNPSTLGVFERDIVEIARRVHAAGGLLYYDGANLNAILGKVRPGDMGFDVIHLNLHKTFSTPHGGGGPGAGPVGVSERLEPFLPVPLVVRDEEGRHRWVEADERPDSIGRLSTFAGNVGILLRGYVYARMLGRDGMARVADYAALNANYLMVRLAEAGFRIAFPERRATHEFIVSLHEEAKSIGLTALDCAKRLLDHGIHAPTTYFPLLVPECLLIEPTETEDLETLDAFVDCLCRIRDEARDDPEIVRTAPHHLPVRRLDEVRAARSPDLVFTGGGPGREADGANEHQR